MSVRTTVPAPMDSAVKRLTRPMGPAPHTRTLQPKVTPPRAHAWTPTASGSMRAPSSRLTLSGSCKIGRIALLNIDQKMVNTVEILFYFKLY